MYKLYCFVEKSLSPPILTDQDLVKAGRYAIDLHDDFPLPLKVYTAHENK